MSSSDSEVEVEVKKDESILQLLKNNNDVKLMSTITPPYRIHFLTVQQLFNDDKISINTWTYQRKQYADHIEILRDALEKKGRLFGAFTFVHNKDNDIVYMIDGQHRYTVIKEYLQKHPKFDMFIQVNVFEVQGEGQIPEIFHNINNSRQLLQNETVDEKFVRLIEMLEKTFPKCFKMSASSRIPYQSKLKLQKFMKKHLSNKIANDRLYQEIIKYNDEYKNHLLEATYTDKIKAKYQKYSKLPRLNRKQKHNDFLKLNGKYAKAEKTGFYLGLFEKFAWVITINDRLK